MITECVRGKIYCMVVISKVVGIGEIYEASRGEGAFLPQVSLV